MTAMNDKLGIESTAVVPLCAANFLADILVDWLYGTCLFRVEITPGTAVLPCTLVCRFVLHGLTDRRRHSTLYTVALGAIYVLCSGAVCFVELTAVLLGRIPRYFGSSALWDGFEGLFALVAV